MNFSAYELNPQFKTDALLMPLYRQMFTLNTVKHYLDKSEVNSETVLSLVPFKLVILHMNNEQ